MRRSRRWFTLLLAIGSPSCSDTAGPAPEDLSPAEAAGLLEVVVAQGLFPSPLPVGRPWPCSDGGTADRSFVFSGQGEVRRDGSVSFAGCRATSQSGDAFTVTGTLSVHDRFRLGGGEIIGADGSYSGTLEWSLGGRSGSCAVDLEPSVSAGNLVVIGTVCDAVVERAV